MTLLLILILSVISLALRITIVSAETAATLYKKLKGSEKKDAVTFVSGVTVSGLRLIRGVINTIRNSLIAGGIIAVLIIVCFFFIVGISVVSFVSLYSTIDENGNLAMNTELVLSGGTMGLTGKDTTSSSSSEDSEDEKSEDLDFKKYSLSDTELKHMANLCYQEQGSVAGAAAEASLMCNLWEEYSGSRYTGLYDYVRNCGWFYRSAYYMDNGTSSDEIVAVVHNVINGGLRVLPKYVDEHDYFGDISHADNDGVPISVRDRSAYKKDVTHIYNTMGSDYYFYSFPAPNSDPFGYKSKEAKQQYGDKCYTLEQCKSGNMK